MYVKSCDLAAMIGAARPTGAVAATRPPCAGQVELFFPPTDAKTALRNAAVDRAKAICAGCARAPSCLAEALARGEPDGVWGGELLRDGEVIPAYVGPGRPRKHPVLAPVAA